MGESTFFVVKDIACKKELILGLQLYCGCKKLVSIPSQGDTVIIHPCRKGTGTFDYNQLCTASTLFYYNLFVGVLWSHLTTICTRSFLEFAYLKG